MTAHSASPDLRTTSEDIVALRALLAAATPRPWFAFDERVPKENRVSVEERTGVQGGEWFAPFANPDDAALIATAVNVLSLLLDDLDALRAALQASPAPLDVERPEIVCLCGSTRFYDDFQQANYDLTMAGRIVLSVGFYPHAKAEHGHGEGVGHDSTEKVALDELHKRKVDLADRVYVLNRGGYIGTSTRSEIEYAKAHGKPVTYAFDSDGVGSPVVGWPCADHDATLAAVGHHDCAAQHHERGDE